MEVQLGSVTIDIENYDHLLTVAHDEFQVLDFERVGRLYDCAIEFSEQDGFEGTMSAARFHRDTNPPWTPLTTLNYVNAYFIWSWCSPQTRQMIEARAAKSSQKGHVSVLIDAYKLWCITPGAENTDIDRITQTAIRHKGIKRKAGVFSGTAVEIMNMLVEDPERGAALSYEEMARVHRSATRMKEYADRWLDAWMAARRRATEDAPAQ